MGRIRVVISVALVTVFLALIGCGGGGNAPRSNVAGSDNPALSSGGTDGGGGVAWWDEDLTGLFPVRMNPQPVKQTGGWPAGRQASSTAVQPGLPAPSALAKLLPQSKQAAYTDADLVKAGAGFDPALPNCRVSAVVAPSLIFSPIWGAQAQPVLADAAYCIYRFSLSDYAASGRPQTLAFAWYPGSAPILPGGDEDLPLWVGFANYGSDHWEWYAGPLDDVLTLASFAPYTAGNGDVLIAVVVLGESDCALLSVKVGQPELRPLGAMPSATGEDSTPPPAGGGSLPSSVDLSSDCSPVGDQGQVGSCSCFATARGVFDYELGRVYKSDGWSFSNAFNLSSTKYLYLKTGDEQGLDCPDGRYTDGVIDYLKREGDSSEKNATYVDVCNQNWGQAAEDDAALLSIEGVHDVDPRGQVGVLKLKTALATQRKVLAVQIGLDLSFFDLGPGAVWNYTGGVLAGYHAMCIVGYDDAKSAFKVRNSWGAAWADGGYCWIGYQTFVDGDSALQLWSWTMDVDYNSAVAQHFCGQHQQLSPPSNVQASDGTDSGVIHVTWTKSAGATGYKVYRDQQTYLTATLGDTGVWDDSGIADYLGHTYWVQATAPGKQSALSAPDVGYLAQAPVISSLSPQTGAPSAVVTFTAQVSGSSPLTYAWDFGGGAVPDTSSNASPQVTLGNVGNYSASLTMTNSYGSDVYGFTLAVRPESAPGDWWMFGHDLQHTRRSLFAGPTTKALKWYYTTGGTVYSSPAIGADGTVYVGSNDNKLYAIRPDGTLKWAYTTQYYVYSSPAIGADGTVYVGSYDDRLYAINSNGSLKWSYTTGDDVFSSPAAGANGTVYVGSMDKKLYAVNPDGSLKWDYTTGDYIGASPALGVDGTVYVGSHDNKLYAINPDGSLKWSRVMGDYVGSSPALGADGTLYVGCNDNKLYAINPNGSLKWSYITGDDVFSSPAISATGTVYVGSYDNKLYAINADGSLKWTYTTGSDIRSSPAISAKGTVYVGSWDGKLYAINPSGSLKWSYTTGGYVRSSPAIGPDGTVYVGSQDGKLYAIGPGGG